MTFFRNTIAAAAVALTVSMPVAQAAEEEEIFALGAAAGAAAVVLLGGAVASALNLDRQDDTIDAGVQPLEIRNDHVAYCKARYRTYDVATDTFQPNHGPRRFCVSPAVR